MTSESKDDLLTTSDDILADARRLREIEAQRAELEPGDPRLKELASESQRAARRMHAGTREELAIATDAMDDAGSAGEPGDSGADRVRDRVDG